jgi:outer membrane protein OmpA-like peptidoglycan-associated protein
MKPILCLHALAAAALLSACASTPTPPPALVDARSAVRSAEADALVLRNAPLELKKAGDSLRRADELSAKGATLADVESAAYVARRQAETAQTLARAKANEDAIKSAEADRERARADARTAEAQRAQRQAAAARADASSARADASSARVEASVAQQQADAAKVEASDAQARAAQARQQAADAQTSATTAQLQAMALQHQLVDLQAQQTDRGMLVTLGDVLFEFGQADIKPGAQGALRKLAAYLQEHPDRRVLIEGHTDSVGSDGANLALSARRAEAVANALASMGVTGSRIATRGYGKSYPVAENTTDTNRALNRRVEVYISDGDRPVRARG